MHRVETDPHLNLIRVSFSTRIDLRDAVAAAQEILLEVEMLNGRGFSMLLDFRDVEPWPPEVAAVWTQLATRARELGLIKSARLIRSELHQASMRVARNAEILEVIRNFTDETEAVDWLTHSTSRPLSARPF